MTMPSLEPEETPLAPHEARIAPRSPQLRVPAAEAVNDAGHASVESIEVPRAAIEPAARRLGADRPGAVRRTGAARRRRVMSWPGRFGAPCLGTLASVAPGSRRRTSPDRVGRFAVAARVAGNPGHRQRGRRPASVRLQDAGRGCPVRTSRVGHRPRRLDSPDPDPAGSRRGTRDGRKRRNDHHGPRFPGPGHDCAGCSAS